VNPTLIRVAGSAAAMAPFAFAMVRAVQTDGQDLRYLWVALAAFAGALLRMVMAARGPRRMTRGTLAIGVFFMAAVFASVAALLLGTAIGPAMFVVATGFAFCFALSTFLRMPAARKGNATPAAR